MELTFTRKRGVSFNKIGTSVFQNYIPNSKLIFALCVIAINTFVRYKRFMTIGSSLGAGNFAQAYIAVRLATTNSANGAEVDGFYDLNRIEIFLGDIATAAAYICIYYFIIAIVQHREGKWKYLIPFLYYVPSLFFETGRSAFFGIVIFLILSFLFVYSLCYGKNFWNSDKGKRIIIKFGLFFIALFMGMSLMMQSDEGEKNIGGELGAKNYLSLYIGSSLVNFNHYVVKDRSRSDYPGQLTFRDTFNNLRSLGLNTKRPEVHLENYYWKGNNREYGSNVFTGFYMAIKDFGILGAIILFGVIGVFYGLMNLKINSLEFNYGSVLPLYIITLVYGTAFWLPYTYQYYSFFSIGFLFRLLLFVLTEKFLIKKICK